MFPIGNVKSDSTSVRIKAILQKKKKRKKNHIPTFVFNSISPEVDNNLRIIYGLCQRSIISFEDLAQYKLHCFKPTLN